MRRVLHHEQAICQQPPADVLNFDGLGAEIGWQERYKLLEARRDEQHSRLKLDA